MFRVMHFFVQNNVAAARFFASLHEMRAETGVSGGKCELLIKVMLGLAWTSERERRRMPWKDEVDAVGYLPRIKLGVWLCVND